VTVTLHTSAFEAMNTAVVLQVLASEPAASAALARARDAFERTEAACTRFVADSPLMRVNAAPGRPSAVPQELFAALEEAALAHAATGGLFDPRVLRPLAVLGYDRSLPFRSGHVHLAGTPPEDAAAEAPAGAGPWQPLLDCAGGTVDVGPLPVDLGGIGKGLAVRWAAAELARAGRVHLVDAGGDCRFGGPGPDGDGWRVGVEDPFGAELPLAVLRADDLAVATSSVRLRTWSAGGRRVHHIVDPRTGTSAAGGLRAVTVVADDAARAEVWAKALLVAGRDGAPALAERHRLAALYVDDDGHVELTPALRPLVLWERPRAEVPAEAG
jgi:FAD:protein FMN transferase